MNEEKNNLFLGSVTSLWIWEFNQQAFGMRTFNKYLYRIKFDINLSAGKVFVFIGFGLLVWLGSELTMTVANTDWRIVLIVPAAALTIKLFLRGDPFKFFLMWLFLGFLFRWWGGIELGHGIPNITVDRVLLATSLFLLCLQVIMHKRRFVTLNSADIFFILFLAASFLSTVWRHENLQEDGLQFVIRDFLPFIAYFLTRNLVRTRVQLREVINVFICVAFLITLWALIEQVLGYSIITGVPLSSIDPHGMLKRSSSSVGHPSATGTAIVILLPFVLHSFSFANKKYKKVLLLSEVALILVAVYYTYIRASWLAVCVILILTAMLNRRLRTFCLGSLIFGIVIILLFKTDITKSAMFIYKLSNPSTIIERVSLSAMQWNLFLMMPFFGHGPAIRNTMAILVLSSHNTYLTLLTEIGLFGVIPNIMVLLVALRKGLTAYMKLPADKYLGKEFVICLLGVVVGYLINALSIDMRFYTILIGVFCVAVALLIRMGEIAYEEDICSRMQKREVIIP